MTQAKHTQGPWRVDANNNVMADGGLVAFPGIAAGFDQKANAALIAAAPELLVALKDAYPYIDNNALRMQIGFVIEKAEGLPL